RQRGWTRSSSRSAPVTPSDTRRSQPTAWMPHPGAPTTRISPSPARGSGPRSRNRRPHTDSSPKGRSNSQGRASCSRLLRRHSMHRSPNEARALPDTDARSQRGIAQLGPHQPCQSRSVWCYRCERCHPPHWPPGAPRRPTSATACSPVTVRRSHPRCRMTAQRALRVALDLLRRRYVAVLMAMLCVQGAFVWTMPLVGALVRRTLHRLGVGGVNADTLDTVASSPVALAVLLGVVIVATVFALADVTVFTVIAHLSLEGEPVTFTGVFARSWRTVRKATGWQGMLLVPYLALLVPISGIGFSSVLTEHIALPKFISGELLKTT